ncbi:hypothetical protein TNIN_153241 [Trichonephila inaurata madagascariensis]|uniref:Uncharacterized protein n=1 Tax=Trichonephila inaurata madagascariensis TaxID=2747483 RepID=A0A8X6XR56_9ARAC|nr:hypothetical protein TNIN_153241 [Trichonephila inaurata madagascariensis]
MGPRRDGPARTWSMRVGLDRALYWTDGEIGPRGLGPRRAGVVRRTSTAWGVRGPDRGATVRDEAGRTRRDGPGSRPRGPGGLERVGIGPTEIWDLVDGS